MLPAIRKLLKDAEPAVQLRVGMALVGQKEKEAVPVLIDLMASRPYEEAWAVEDLLLRVAGDKALTLIWEAMRRIARNAGMPGPSGGPRMKRLWTSPRSKKPPLCLATRS